MRAKVQKQKPRPFVGEKGLALVEYQGDAPGLRRWPSSLPGVFYLFGTARRVGYIDVRDLAAYVGVKEPDFMDAKRAFRLVKHNVVGKDDKGAKV